jgi:CRP/FNR family transcriptional regulator, cyclic AMP receptor protein
MYSEDVLRQIGLFRSLENEELRRLSPLLKERRAPRGSYIVYADDPGPSVMFILDGRVKITLVSPKGKEVIIASLGKGEFFGEIALLTGDDRSANVVAVSDCHLLVLSAEDFKKHILNNSGLALELMKELALRIRTSSIKIGDLALYDVLERVLRTLRALGRNDGDKFVVRGRPTHQEIATMIGTSREMVSRALKSLEDQGIIAIEGKTVTILGELEEPVTAELPAEQ